MGRVVDLGARQDVALGRALAKRPADRFPDCRAFLDAMSIEVDPRGLMAEPSVSRTTPRRWYVVASAVAVVAVSGSALMLAPAEGDVGLSPQPHLPSFGPTSAAASDDPTGAAARWPMEGPDGVIVFAGERDGNYDIWVVRPDGSDLRRLTTAPARERSPDVSPDGSSIVYTSGRDGHRDLYRVSADGSGREPLTTSDHDDYAPAISPDGQRVAWVSDRSGNLDIWIMSDNGSGFDEDTAVNVTDHSSTDGGHSDQLPAWFADGQRIVFNSNRAESADIWVVDTEDEGAPIQLTRDRTGDFHATVNADGAIAYVRRRTQDLNRELYALLGEGQAPRRLTETSAHELGPDFAPDGERLVTARGGVRPDLTEFDTTLAILNIDGDDLGTLVLGLDNAVDPAWVARLGPAEPRPGP